MFKTPQQPTELSIEFVHEEVCYQYEIAFTRQAIISEALYIDTFERVLIYSRTTDIEEQLTKISPTPHPITRNYRYLLDREPRILQSVPLKYIASYIGITPQALSRI